MNIYEMNPFLVLPVTDKGKTFLSWGCNFRFRFNIFWLKPSPSLIATEKINGTPSTL